MRELFLDLETSGTDPVKHSVLSIGMVVSYNKLEDYQSFYREIKHDELVVVPRSMEVNKLDLTDQAGRVPLLQADEEAVSFIKKHFGTHTNPMSIGLNIGVFDLQFIMRQLPLLAEKLGYKSVDLNSLIYVLSEKHSRDFKELKQEMSEKAHTTMSKLALGVEQHNALYDAVFNLCLYLLIKEELL